MKQYWSRVEHEKLYKRLCDELGIIVKSFKGWSDYTLLQQINMLLITLHCMPMDESDLEQLLH